MGYDLNTSQNRYVRTHARALSLHSSFNLVGSVDTSATKRSIFEKTFNTPSYENISDALFNQNIDLVIISTPTNTHFEVLQRILNLATPKIILCEKPLSYDLKESIAMVELCKDKSVDLYVNYMRRSEPGALNIKKRIEANITLGDFSGTAYYSNGFLNNGSHLYNLLEYWLGETVEFKVINKGQSTRISEADPDVYVTFSKGSVVFQSVGSDFSHNTIELISSAGRLRYDYGGHIITWTPVEKRFELKEIQYLSLDSVLIPSDMNRYQFLVADQLSNCKKCNKINLCTGEEALRTLKNMHLILDSIYE